MKPDVGPVHSDLCPPGHDLSRGVSDPEWRELIHACLDEWIDKSESTGYFFIGDSENYFVITEQEEEDDEETTDIDRKRPR